MFPGGLRQIVLVVLATAVTVVASDLALQRICPLLPRRMEAADGIALVRDGDPETLVIGSSHGRSFVRIAEAVARASDGRRQLVPIPVEYGKQSTYEWILDHRLRPLLEERRPDGGLVRGRLRRLVLVTEWWDACSPETGLAFNVPARGYTAGDFLADAARRGLDGWNQNYLDQGWSALWRGSILVQDRGVGRLVDALRDALGRRGGGDAAERYARNVATWRAMIEAGAADPRCHDGHERAALERILDWAQARGLDTTLLLFPRKPDTLTDRARRTTLAAYAQDVEALASRRGLRFVDATTSTPVTDADFMADFDHLNPAGNEKFERWALSGPLRFLLEPAERLAAP
jgi:hypothetical protein